MPELAAARPLPQFLRSLRGFAAVHVLGNVAHDRVFTPFVDARRRAHLAPSLKAQLQALDATALRHALRAAITEIAAAQWPSSPSDARALDAYLEDAARPAFDALLLAEQTARSVGGAGDPEGERGWSTWVASLETVFRTVDTFWVAIQPVIAPSPARLRAPLPAAASTTSTEGQ